MMMNEGGYCFLIRRKIPFPDYLEVNKDCPLIEIPTPHGRLIDGDNTFLMMGDRKKSLIDAFNLRPILEAED